MRHFILYSALALFLLPNLAEAGVLGKPANNLNLSGYWAFNEGTGSTYGDSSGNGNSGAVTGAPTWINGKRGKALQFDGSDDHLVVTDSISLRQGTDWTMSAWIKIKNNDPGAAADRIIVGKQGWHGGILRQGDAIWFNITNTVGTSHYITYSVTPEEWHFYTATYTGSSGAMELYVDGASVGTQTFNTATTMNYQGTSDLYIGGSGTDQYHTYADIDEVRIYSRKLTAAQIQALYGSGAVTRSVYANADLVGFWTFDLGHIKSSILDVSGKGNHGYFHNGATSSAIVSGKIGEALKFDGVDDAVRIPHNAAFSFARTDPFTISVWAKTTNASDSATPLVTKGDNAADFSGYSLAIKNSAGQIDFIFSSSANTNRIYWRGTAGVTVTNWNHYVVTYDGSSNVSGVKVYINGSAKTSSYTENTLTNPTTNSRNLGIGEGDMWDVNPNVQIDDVRIYSRALSPSEVTALYGMTKQSAAPTKVNSSQNSLMTSGLINFWSFNGANISNGTIVDHIGGNTGTTSLIATTTFYTSGKVGQGVEFSGTDMVNLPTVITLSHTSNWTISVWAKTTNAGTQYIMTHQSGNPVTNAIRVVSGKINYYHYNGVWNSESGSATVNDGNWHLLTWANNGDSTLDMYVDGVLDADNVASNNSGPLNRIGNSWAGDSGFVGTLDELRIYNRTLSAAEVKQLYLMGK